VRKENNMAEVTAVEHARLEAAAGSVVAKLHTLCTGMTPDEQRVLAVALHHMGIDRNGAERDTAGYIIPGALGPLVVVAAPVLVVLETVKSSLAGLGASLPGSGW
jgi:hypothetical protein